MPRKMLGLLLIAVFMGALAAPSAAQGGPDGRTDYELNMRTGPGGSYPVITLLPPNTGLIFEAHNADLSWLLGHTEDGVWRGWVASGYLSYREGFSATRLPISEEIVTPGSSAPVSAENPATVATPAGKPNGTVESMTLIHSTGHSEYYRLTYWSDGLRVNGFIGYPTGASHLPAVVYNRGGAWDTGALYGGEIVPWVECGYVAAASQYRGNGGSEGGETFGSGDVNDAINLVILLQSLPQVDPGRIGMMGGSRGGMVTYIALKMDALSGANRIRVAATVGGISDLFMWADQRPKIVNDVYLPLIGATPTDRPDLYQERSAVYWPELINAPILLQHGEADNEVSVEESRKLFAALKGIGKSADLITYPGDDHPLNGQLGGYREAINWFGRYLNVTGRYDDNWDAINTTTQWFIQNRS